MVVDYLVYVYYQYLNYEILLNYLVVQKYQYDEDYLKFYNLYQLVLFDFLCEDIFEDCMVDLLFYYYSLYVEFEFVSDLFDVYSGMNDYNFVQFENYLLYFQYYYLN